MIGTLVSRRVATLCELQTVYSTQDAYELLEVVQIDAHNDAILNKPD